MKTLGRIALSLTLLLGLYVFGYWLLFRKEWAYNSLYDITKPWYSPETYNTLYDVFDPVRRLDFFFTTVVPFRNSFTGHWSSESGNDFIILGSDLECHFKLGGFAFEGKASYGREDHDVFVEFFHQKRRHYLYLYFDDESTSPNSELSASRRTRAKARVYHFDERDMPRTRPGITDYESTLTK